MTTVADIVAVLETAYPPALAEDWDSVGLICGDPEDQVTRTAFALEATDAVVEEALDAEAEMLVVHHPLLLRGVDSVAADTAKGRIIHKLIRGGCALFAAHTNADSARPGVNDRLAELVGVVPGRPIKPKSLTAYDHWGVHVLGKDAEQLKRALFGGQLTHENAKQITVGKTVLRTLFVTLFGKSVGIKLVNVNTVANHGAKLFGNAAFHRIAS